MYFVTLQLLDKKYLSSVTNYFYFVTCHYCLTQTSQLQSRIDIVTLAKIEEKQPKIIALTEILPKNNEEVNEAEFDISGYNTFLNKSLKRGVILIIHKDLNAIECEILNDSQFEESVWCSFIDGDGDSVLIGGMYRSPNSTRANTQEMYDLLNNRTIGNFKKVCIMGDFNFPTIKWKGGWYGNDGNEFVEQIRDALLIQKVRRPN